MDEWHVSDSDSEEDYGTAEANGGERHDRLSELPDSLIVTILSLLDLRDAVRTSLLSQRWKNLWSTIPCLDFIEFEQTPSIISSILSQWKGPKILKFRLSFPYCIVCPSSVVDSWLLFATEKQVEKLFLDLTNLRDLNSDEKDVYCLPQPVYSCSWITKLTLVYCKLRIEDNVQWDQLKRLKLIFVDGLSGDAMNQILLGAPRLEELVLETVENGENQDFNIRSTSLKMLKIRTCHFWHDTSVLRIWAPNLLTIHIGGFLLGTYLLDVSSLTHAILCLHVGDVATQFEMFNHVFRGIRHAEKLTLSDWCTEMLVELKNQDMVMSLLNSKILELEYADVKDVLDLVGMMFPKLERLIVYQGDRRQGMVDSLASAKMTFPSPSLLHLKTFEATWSMSDPSIIPAIQILLENTPILEKMVIRLRRHTSHVVTFLLAQEKVLSMPRCSPTAQVIISLV